MIGLGGALVLRIILLFFIATLAGLSEPFFTVFDWGISWLDVTLVLGGLFLIYKASTEIFTEVEGGVPSHGGATLARVTLSAVIVLIMLLDLVFSSDSVITAVGIADHIEVMVAAICVAIVVMMVAATPISNFVEAHPSTKMLALAFLLMVGMALVADGFQFHIERGFIYAAMLFGGGVEALNPLRQKRRRASAD